MSDLRLASRRPTVALLRKQEPFRYGLRRLVHQGSCFRRNTAVHPNRHSREGGNPGPLARPPLWALCVQSPRAPAKAGAFPVQATAAGPPRFLLSQEHSSAPQSSFPRRRESRAVGTSAPLGTLHSIPPRSCESRSLPGTGYSGWSTKVPAFAGTQYRNPLVIPAKAGIQGRRHVRPSGHYAINFSALLRKQEPSRYRLQRLPYQGSCFRRNTAVPYPNRPAWPSAAG